MLDDIQIESYFFNGITEINSSSSIQILPNPTSDFISIKTDKTIQLKSATITDIAGKSILTTNKTEIDVSQFATGIYFVQLITDKGKFETKALRN